tara:strand:+ start:170 stop:958 length:789 start_codon:yes stop_codon:yes gene_type:complete
VTKNKFKIIFDRQGEQIDAEYILADTFVAEKWFKKIKHLKNIDIDKIESGLEDVSNLPEIYKNFCMQYNLQQQNFDWTKQDTFNQLHKIYENNHEKISKTKNNHLLYKFHHAIHEAESPTVENKRISVSWGIKEGPLTEKFTCHDFYEDEIVKNNIYLSWAELGKKPLTYWRNKEPDNQRRINELCKPHITARAKFFLNLSNAEPKNFPTKFTIWFEKYKQGWLHFYNINDYQPKHHYSAPILAYADHTLDLTHTKFKRLEL